MEASQVTGQVMESALSTAASNVGSAISDMVDTAEADLSDLERLAIDTSNAILSALWRAGVVQPLTAAALGAVSGGSNSSAGGGITAAVPPPAIGPQSFAPEQVAMSGGAAAGPVVQFQIQAMDGPSVVKALHDNRASIVGIVQEAYNRRGSRGPMG